MTVAVSSATQTHISFQLPQFEGPLGLLLYLIRKEEMDIMDIQIHKITGQYLEYIKMIKELNLEVAGDFVSMAATLIQIKSKMLLPQYDENGEIVENEDPRKELVQRLLEYQKYQEAAKSLYERPLLGRDVWTRGVREDFESHIADADKEAVEVEANPVFSLITAFRKVLKSAKNKVHKVNAKLQSIASRILEIREVLQVGVRVPFSDLIQGDLKSTEQGETGRSDRRRKVLITFLSLLELGKLGFISLFQTEAYRDIYVEAKKSIGTEAITNVEEYNTMADFNYTAMEQKAQAVDETFSLEDDVPVETQSQLASDEEIALAEKELTPADSPSEEIHDAQI
jgi:segregation and condensation protein A